MTEYHRVPASIAIYWPSTIKYQPISLPTSHHRILSLFTTHLMSHVQFTWSSSWYCSSSRTHKVTWSVCLFAAPGLKSQREKFPLQLFHLFLSIESSPKVNARVQRHLELIWVGFWGSTFKENSQTKFLPRFPCAGRRTEQTTADWVTFTRVDQTCKFSLSSPTYGWSNDNILGKLFIPDYHFRQTHTCTKQTSTEWHLSVVFVYTEVISCGDQWCTFTTKPHFLVVDMAYDVRVHYT